MRKPVINVYANPLPGVDPIQILPRVGDLIVDHAPTERFPWVCVVNGLPLKREYWMRRTIQMGDVVELHSVVMGGGTRSILGVIASIALSVFAPWISGPLLGLTGITATLVSAGIMLVGTALINALIMPKPAGAGQNEVAQASPTYSVAMAGNQARLNQPIPVGYGRLRTYPDYAAQPYTEFSTETNPDGDEYFYGFYAIGHGEYDIGAVLLGNSDINSFTDVEYRILRPGQKPILVDPNVVSAVEVANQVVKFDELAGPFAACPPGRRLRSFRVDVVFPRGLCVIDKESGKPQGRSVEIEISYRPINDAFTPLGEWITVPVQTVRASTLTPQRRSFAFDLPAGLPSERIAVRMRRLTEEEDDQYIYDQVMWAGLRSYLKGAVPLAPTVTHLEVKIRASEQISGASQRKIGVVWQRKIRTWSPAGGMSGLVATRNPMWALLDKWTNTVYGDRIPLDRIDLKSVYRIAQTCEQRRDRFDIIFDSRISSFEGDMTIARVCRSSPIRRNGMRSVIRDERMDFPIAAFTPRNVIKGSSSYQYLQTTEETADGVIVEYFDHNAFDWLQIECPQPGRTVTNPNDHRYNASLPVMENPVLLQMPGITGPTHAEREGLYQAAVNALRRKYAQWQCELEGSLVHFGAPVLFSPVLHNATKSADAVTWDASTLALGTSEQLEIDGAMSAVLVRPDGSLTDPIRVYPGPDEWSIKLSALPDFPIRTRESGKARTRIILTNGQELGEICKMLAIRPRGEQRYEMYAVVENDTVHTVDNHLLGAADDPDQFAPWPSEPGPPLPPGVVKLSNITVVSTGMWAAPPATVRFGSDGRLATGGGGFTGAGVTGSAQLRDVAGQWLSRPVPGAGESYEIQVRRSIPVGFWDNPNPSWTWPNGIGPYTVEGAGQYGGGTAYSEWLPLDDSVTITFADYPAFNGRVRIRPKGGSTISADVQLRMSFSITGGA